jgi:diphthamide biosynthesis methyltransferase
VELLRLARERGLEVRPIAAASVMCGVAGK